jgi:hypothetical protein
MQTTEEQFGKEGRCRLSRLGRAGSATFLSPRGCRATDDRFNPGEAASRRSAANRGNLESTGMSQVRRSFCCRHGAVALATLLSLAGVAPRQGRAAPPSDSPPTVPGTPTAAAEPPSPVSDIALRQILASYQSESLLPLTEGLVWAPLVPDRMLDPRDGGSRPASWGESPRVPFDLRVGGWVQIDATGAWLTRRR